MNHAYVGFLQSEDFEIKMVMIGVTMINKKEGANALHDGGT